MAFRNGALPDGCRRAAATLVEQPFRGGPEISVWMLVPRALWEYAGTLTLKAAGLDDVVETEAWNTWFEILGQSLGQMAQPIGAVLGLKIGCDGGVERQPHL